jgi:antitoxin ParD1/3/4
MPTTMTISLPDEMKAFIEQQITAGSFSSASEFIRQLVREEQKRAEQDRMERKLLDGLESGQPIRATDEYWRKLRKRIEQGAGHRRTSGSRK